MSGVFFCKIILFLTFSPIEDTFNNTSRDTPCPGARATSTSEIYQLHIRNMQLLLLLQLVQTATESLFAYSLAEKVFIQQDTATAV